MKADTVQCYEEGESTRYTFGIWQEALRVESSPLEIHGIQGASPPPSCDVVTLQLSVHDWR